MSLSFFLQKPSRHRRLETPESADNDIRRFFYENFPRTRGVVRESNSKLAESRTIRPESPRHRPVPYGELGMAIDYRLRYFFAVTPYRDLVAWKGSQRHVRRLERTYDLPSTVIEAFFVNLEDFLAHADPSNRQLEVVDERQLNRFCFVLALFEQLFRINPHPKNLLFAQQDLSTASDLLLIAEDLWIDDMCLLSSAFYEKYKDRLSDTAHLNPNFQGSRDIGGADADLILGDCLLELKTTVNPEITNSTLYQLLGYVLLDYEDEYELKEIGIYLTRQATTLRWDLSEILDRLHTTGSPPPLEELRQIFRSAVRSATLALRATRLARIQTRLRSLRR